MQQIRIHPEDFTHARQVVYVLNDRARESGAVYRVVLPNGEYFTLKGDTEDNPVYQGAIEWHQEFTLDQLAKVFQFGMEVYRAWLGDDHGPNAPLEKLPVFKH